MKGFKICTDFDDVSVLVVAGKASEAKGMAFRTEWFCDCDYIDLIVKREPKIDYLSKNGKRLIDGSGKGDGDIMRDLGWFELENTLETCSDCGLHPFSSVPESELIEGICRGCKQ